MRALVGGARRAAVFRVQICRLFLRPNHVFFVFFFVRRDLPYFFRYFVVFLSLYGVLKWLRCAMKRCDQNVADLEKKYTEERDGKRCVVGAERTLVVAPLSF